MRSLLETTIILAAVTFMSLVSMNVMSWAVMGEPSVYVTSVDINTFTDLSNGERLPEGLVDRLHLMARAEDPELPIITDTRVWYAGMWWDLRFVCPRDQE